MFLKFMYQSQTYFLYLFSDSVKMSWGPAFRVSDRVKAIDSGDFLESKKNMIWIFGYGPMMCSTSPNFPVNQKIVGFVHGFKRG